MNRVALFGSCLPLFAFGGIIVDAHEQMHVTRVITNDTSETQTIVGIRSSCACLTVDCTKRVVKPHAISNLELFLNPAGMEGPVRKTVDVTLSPSGRRQTYVIEADVRLRLGYKPADAAFGVVSRKDVCRTVTAELSGYVAKETRILGLVPPDWSVFDVREKSGRLMVGFRDPEIGAGVYAETWIIKTSDPEVPEIRFPVSACVSDILEVSPQVITMESNGSVSARFVLLRAADHRPFKVQSAETLPRKWGDVRIEARPLNGWRICIENIDPNEVRQFSKKPFLKVKTNLPGMESVEIPLRVDQERGAQ